MPRTSTVSTGTWPGPVPPMMPDVLRMRGVQDIAAQSAEAVKKARGPGVAWVRTFCDTDAPLLVAPGPAMHDREDHETRSPDVGFGD